MSLLDGTLSGSFPFEVDLGSYEDENGKIKKLTIKEIITEGMKRYI
jgi:hypothetical protein